LKNFWAAKKNSEKTRV